MAALLNFFFTTFSYNYANFHKGERMKKIVLASVLVAGVLFAADFQNSTPEQINASVAGADAKNLSEAAFEIDK